MGQTMPLPDERLEDTMELLELRDADVKKFHKVFTRIDKDNSGNIDNEEFYGLVKEKQSIFTDHIFELIETERDGILTFSEFVQAVCTYCMFGKEEILKFCFYVFDTDKNGFIEKDELEQLVQLLHQQAMFANVRKVVMEHDKDGDGKISFPEFKHLHRKFPQLLYPAFRLQTSIMVNTLGMRWWERKRSDLQRKRDKERELADELERQEERKQRRMALARAKRKMGPLRYYLCPLQRARFIKKAGFDTQDDALDELSSGSDEEEKEDEGGKKGKKKANTGPPRRWRKRRRRGKRRVSGPGSRAEGPTPTPTAVEIMQAKGDLQPRTSAEERRQRREVRSKRRARVAAHNERALARMMHGEATRPRALRGMPAGTQRVALTG